jgi:glutamine phosphoribosylpyrophosphate amidotransferase
VCAVIGVCLRGVSEDDLSLVRNLFNESMIRGKHATGVSYVKEEQMFTIKEPVPVPEFLKTYSESDWVDEGNLLMVGHIRYSTSSREHNQPFDNGYVSVVHNGVISQDPDIWEFDTETDNDSELILRAIEAGENPLEYYKDRSMAVVTLHHDGLMAFRNHERPLWYAERDNGIIFASTRNILERSGITEGLHKCERMVKYSYIDGLKEDRSLFDPDLEDLQ